MTTSGSRSSTDANMRGPGSTMGNVDNTLQANLLRNNNNLSDSEEEDSKEEPPPYSRYDPLSQQPPQQPPRPQYPQQGPWIPPSQLGNTGYLQPPSNSQHRPSQSSSPQNNGSNGRWFAPNAPNQPLSSTQSPPSPAIPRPPFQYPPGYFCPKCHNTGFKIYNGSPCGTCARLFGRQSANVRYVPDGYSAIPPPNALVVPAGDPRLGGVLCGNCKGSGRVVSLLFFDTNCPICLGVGRIR